MSGLVLPATLGDWLLEIGVFDHSDLESPPVESYVLGRRATGEFENGVRIARLLQELGSVDEDLDTLKEVNTPVAKLYNWNLLLPKLRRRGLDVDQDMKVLIVAGDLEIVVDLLEQLHRQGGGAGLGGGHGGGDDDVASSSMPPPASASASTSVTQFLAFCCRQELGSSWGQSVALVRNHRQLARQQTHGAHGASGGFVPVVRWYKLVFSHCKHLCHLAQTPADISLALHSVGSGLSSVDLVRERESHA